jgi:hypothetical protein
MMRAFQGTQHQLAAQLPGSRAEAGLLLPGTYYLAAVTAEGRRSYQLKQPLKQSAGAAAAYQPARGLSSAFQLPSAAADVAAGAAAIRDQQRMHAAHLA